MEPESLGVAQQHLRLSVGVGSVMRIHVLSDAKLTSYLNSVWLAAVKCDSRAANTPSLTAGQAPLPLSNLCSQDDLHSALWLLLVSRWITPTWRRWRQRAGQDNNMESYPDHRTGFMERILVLSTSHH